MTATAQYEARPFGTGRQRMTPALYAIVPVKRLIRAKTRLSPALSFAQRLVLARRFLRRTLAIARQFPGAAQTIVVSGDPAVRAVARREGMIALNEPGAGCINRAVDIGLAWARRRNARAIVVLPTDLPLLTPRALRGFARLAGTPRVRLAADRHGSGTNALYLQPVQPRFARFGDGSLQKHRAAALASNARVETVHENALAFDVDVPADLKLLAALKR